MTSKEAIHILKEQIIGIEETRADCIDSYLVDIDAIKAGIDALEKLDELKTLTDLCRETCKYNTDMLIALQPIYECLKTEEIIWGNNND